MSTPTTFILLDDHSLFLNGLEILLKDMFANAEVFKFNSINELGASGVLVGEVDLLISDVEIPDEDVLSYLESIKIKGSNFPMLIVSMHKKLCVVNFCKSIGIEGYLLKSDAANFENAILKLLNGKRFFSPEIQQILTEIENTKVLLSKREEEVLRGICKGYNNQQLATHLSVGSETIKTHKKNIKIKLGIHENHEMIAYARKNLII